MPGNDENTLLLIHSNETDGSTTFVDTAIGGNAPHTINKFGDTHHETDEQKFGTTAIYFDESGDYLTVDDDVDWDFGAGDWTVDFWLRAENSASSAYMLTDTAGNLRIAWNKATGFMNVFYKGVWTDDTDYTININTWYHIAVVRSGTNLFIFVDGQKSSVVGSPSGSQDFTGFNIGRRQDGSFYMKGYLDEIRFSNTARWTSNFTPPTSAYGSEFSVTVEDASGEFTLSPVNVDASTSLGAPITVLRDVSFDLRSIRELRRDLPLDLRASSGEIHNVMLDLRATNGITLIDCPFDLRATDGIVTQDVTFDLRAATTPPEFKSYVAHRLSSIISDTGVSI